MYICSLPRTGSTVIADALTNYPHSLIVSEALLLGKGGLLETKLDELCQRNGLSRERVGLEAALQNYNAPNKAETSAAAAFVVHVLPVLRGMATQVGIKEIYHAHWRELFERVDDVRVVFTVRDPRDIYLSLLEMRKHFKLKNWRWHNLTIPEIAALVNTEFEHQRQIAQDHDPLTVRYEDFCRDPERETSRVREFVESPMPDLGEIGVLNKDNPNRSYEHEKHGPVISAKSVERWKTERNPKLVTEACQLAELMGPYMDFFGYT